MKKVIVFGGGMIGCAVIKRLAQQGHTVFAVDLKSPPGVWHSKLIECDFSQELDIPLSNYDLAVNCAPSKYGYKVAKYIIENGIDCVDIAFYVEDPFTLSELAYEKGVTYIPDAGFAPGLTNLLFGKEYSKLEDDLRTVEMGVGGVATSPFAPYGYSVTWSPEDLMEEYKRPAKVVQNGDVVTLPQNNCIDVEVYFNDNYVDMEGLVTDGLRTLLRYRKNMINMEEYTLRWPGHYKKVLPYIREGKEKGLAEELRNKCSNIPDTVIMDCWFNDKNYSMVLHGDHKETAMVKATAGTCAVVSEAVLDRQFLRPGVFPLEELGKRVALYDFIMTRLKEREGIIIEER